MSTPYTYLIGWSSTKMFYYGAKYGKTANPKHFWINYFTSSNIVKRYRQKHGEPDIIEIRKIFDDPVICRNWEFKVLRRIKVTNRRDFLNVCVSRSFPSGISPKVSPGRQPGFISHLRGKIACHDPMCGTIKYINNESEIPIGFIKGTPKKSKECNFKNSTSNKKRWAETKSDPIRAEEMKRYFMARTHKPSKNKKWFYNVETLEQKYFYIDEAPDGWSIGRKPSQHA